MQGSRKTKAAKLAGGALMGGLAAGLLMAMAVPTTMKRHAEDWRDLIGVRDTSAQDATPVLLFEAPPQDLTPVAWQTASQEYAEPAMQDDDMYLAEIDMSDPLFDDQPRAEPLPGPLVAEITRYDTQQVALDDRAGRAAEAAREAAADVRAVENGTVASTINSDDAGADGTVTVDAPPVAEVQTLPS